MDKHRILEEIKRLASANDGKPPAMTRFERETGIRRKDWNPTLWVRWGEALQEAGFSPNRFKTSAENYVKDILSCVAACADSEDAANQNLRFFREFNSALKAQTGVPSRGNRNFLVSPFQRSIINVINSVCSGGDNKLSAKGSPRIEWNDTSPLQK